MTTTTQTAHRTARSRTSPPIGESGRDVSTELTVAILDPAAGHPQRLEEALAKGEERASWNPALVASSCFATATSRSGSIGRCRAQPPPRPPWPPASASGSSVGGPLQSAARVGPASCRDLFGDRGQPDGGGSASGGRAVRHAGRDGLPVDDGHPGPPAVLGRARIYLHVQEFEQVDGLAVIDEAGVLRPPLPQDRRGPDAARSALRRHLPRPRGSRGRALSRPERPVSGPRRVVATGLDVVAHGRCGLGPFWDSITAGRTATRKISTFDPAPFRLRSRPRPPSTGRRPG